MPVRAAPADDTTPRMRGLLRNWRSVLRPVRYNPAYAGTTRYGYARNDFFSIQPRVCGDYQTVPGGDFLFQDTTPRMRGLPAASCPSSRARRYNPAYAGTTVGLVYNSRWCAIQPRVCGDYASRIVLLSGTLDTTPRMRGLRHAQPYGTSEVRYNPAYAGTTMEAMGTANARAIQPRVCGDYRF